MAQSVTVVTVAFNSSNTIRKSLEPLYGPHEIICIDNASDDDLAGALAGLDVRIIRNSRNIGFGRACNQGLASASGDFVLFLNPDVTIDKASVQALTDASETYPDCGVFLPLTRRLDGSLWLRNHYADFRGRNRRDDITSIAGDFCSRFLDGSIFLIRRSLLIDLGGFDEKIFLYYEDDDLSQRLAQRREPIIVVIAAEARHAVGKSVTEGAMGNLRRNRHKKVSEIYYRSKYGFRHRLSRDLIVTIGKIVLYCALLDGYRLSGACGRLLGILDSVRHWLTRKTAT